MKVTAKKRFFLGRKMVGPGTVDVPDEKVSALAGRGLIEAPSGETTAPDEGSDRMEAAISRFSAAAGFERVGGESAVDFLERLADEAEVRAGKAQADASDETPEDLERFTVVELKDMAKTRGVERYSTMNKGALIEALKG